MQYRQLGTSELQVSEICLGTMTYGQQNSREEAHQQLDYAIAQGVNFIDTAEMYPVPARATTQGLTETYLGEWLAHQQRDRLVIATKIAGPSRGMGWIRQGQRAIDRINVQQAVDNSLRRLQTDYIDLYQIHWPDRNVPLFGQDSFNPQQERPTVPIAEQLVALSEVIQAGKVRYLGLSNETPWGVVQFCRMAEQLGLPKVVAVQNAYNLLNRVSDWAMAEACYREGLAMLAYSPLGFGSLSGKYLEAREPAGRLHLFPGFGQRYLKPNVSPAVTEYIELAQQFDLSPITLALAFVRQRWFVTSTIVGATTLAQLQQNLASGETTLGQEVLAAIDLIHNRYPNPAP